jgi:hypothetical protein
MQRDDKVADQPKPAPAGARSKLRLLTIEELDNLPDPAWLVHDILPEGGIAVLYGQPGAGKSFLALDLALSVSVGRSWFGHPTQHGGVVYVYAEGASGLKKRIAAWRKRNPGDTAAFRVLPQALDITDAWANLMAALGQMTSPSRLLIIDTLARCFGAGDENSTGDMGAFIACLDELRAAFPQLAILIVHHSGKDDTKGARGSTALKGAADAVMHLVTKGPLLFLKSEKQKDAGPFDDLSFLLDVVRLPSGATSCVLKDALIPANDRGPQRDPRAEGNDRRLLDALAQFGSAGARFKQWMTASGLPRSTFKDALKRLEAANQVTSMARVYTISQRGPETGRAGTGPESEFSAPAA